MNSYRLLFIFSLLFLTASASAQLKEQQRPDVEPPVSFYLGGAYTARSLGGVTLLAGVAYQRHDLQLSYTLGLQKSDPVYWYDDDGIWLSSMKYRQQTFAVRYGYRLPAGQRFIITPQLGYSYHTLSGQQDEGEGRYGHSAHSSSLTLGMRVQCRLLPPVSVFLTPEYALALSQDTYYKHTADVSNFSASGFALTAGLTFDF
ncbi:MAG: autotransporter outer membrane beta-barrel domain-containing protein [Bacteroidaceae bacterium]|nr:autotransporter outer membrane beta-barrel domain-containing protein [Bacteroidaceae bacterium]